MSYSKVVGASHIGVALLSTLVGRPISRSNSTYVDDCTRSLKSVETVLEAASASLPPALASDCCNLADRLHRLSKTMTAPAIHDAIQFIHQDFRIYREVCQSPLTFGPLSSRLLVGRRYRRIIVMIGPGIGIGDEVKFYDFLRGLMEYFQIDPESVAIYTFFPGVWEALEARFETHGLVGRPLDALDRLNRVAESSGGEGMLFVFANFMWQRMFRCFFGKAPPTDWVEVSLAAAQAWFQQRHSRKAYTVKMGRRRIPNQSRGLELLLDHLLPARMAKRPRRSLTTYKHDGDAVFRVMLNPFTSKPSPFVPGDWAQFLRTVRRALPGRLALECRVFPGVSKQCESYARQIADEGGTALGMRSRDRVDILKAADGTKITTQNGIVEAYRAIERADFLLSVDTFTAHLAAHAPTTSLALCLNRNSEFWQPAAHTLWIDINTGRSNVNAVIRLIVKLMTGTFSNPNTLSGYAERCRQLVALGHPEELEARLQRGHLRWRARADATWRAMPAPMQRILHQVDGTFAWPVVSRMITSGEDDRVQEGLNCISDSLFFRLSCLAAAEPPQDARVLP